MSGRKCGNCRHYEPSPIWRSGWCRNPRLYGPQESHLVRQEELACAHRIGNYWEPAADDEAAEPGRIAGIVRPLRLFGPGPRLLAATSGSGGGGSGRFDAGGAGGRGGSGSGRAGAMGSAGFEGDRDAFGGAGGKEGAASGRPPAGGPGRPDPTGRLPGQERIVSYQPEERYWTDYLRIALPVVGLLLMLGLFWFWAANLIGGDDDEDEPQAALATSTATATVAAAGTTPDVAAPTATTGVSNPPSGQAPQPTTSGPVETPTTEPAVPTAAETDNPPADGEFPIGSSVVVIDADVNFREGPSTGTTAIRILANGEELEVTGEVQVDDASGLRWLPVRDVEGRDGYVAADYVVLVE